MAYRNTLIRFSLALSLSAGFLVSDAAAQPDALTQSSKISIKNFGRISDLYYRGAQPKGHDFEDLAALGVKAVIDLTQGDSSSEPGLVKQAGMRFYRIPLVTTSRPPAEAVARFLSIVNDPANQPVYVHCAGGRHRTGVMTAAYRLTHDSWDADSAFAEMRKFDFEGGWVNHNALKSFVYEYFTQVRKSANTVIATVVPQQPQQQ